VICIDNFITGSPRNIEHLFGRDGFSFVKHDVTNYIYVDGAGRLRAALRVAGQPDRLPRAADPDAEGRLARHAQGARPGQGEGARFLLASTSEVYGDPLVHPQKEDYWGNVNPVGPRGVYDEAKRFAEAMTMAYHRFHGVDTRSSASSTPTARGCAQRRPRDPGVHRAGAARRAADRVRRRLADALVLLRHRSRRRRTSATRAR
jgi:nucleoside-diphosphate-sugar epimerase